MHSQLSRDRAKIFLPFSTFSTWPTDEHEVIEILAGLSNNQSLGYIDIPVTLIKESKFVGLVDVFRTHLTNA